MRRGKVRVEGGGRTEELLGAATLLDDLDKAGLELLDRGNVVRQDAHLAGLRGDVDLDDALGLVERLHQIAAISTSRLHSATPNCRSPPSSNNSIRSVIRSGIISIGVLLVLFRTWLGSDKLSLICIALRR